MATPGVTGVLLLLQQYNEQLYGSYLKGATLKGLALHTAYDAGQAGPDYKMGWGVLNPKKAAEVLINKDYATHMSEERLEEGAIFSYDFSLIVSGVSMNQCSTAIPDKITLDNALENEVTLRWEETLDALYEVQYKHEIETQWITEYVTDNFLVLSELENNENYVVQIRTFCSQNISSEYTHQYGFTFKGLDTFTGLLDANETLTADDEINFSVYPNPAAEEIRLNTEVSDTAMYSIVSSSGIELKHGAAKDAKINVADLATGLYIIQVQDFGVKKNAKFFKY